MKISIVVPAFNEAKLLAESLGCMKAAAEAFTARGWAWELVVCNNNSTDATGDIASAEGATVIFEPINQIARARNTGASAATGDWLIFVDADSRPSRDLFADTAEMIATGRYVAGGATVKMDEPFPVMGFLTWLWNSTSRIRKWCAGSFIFCEARAFREIGGFSHELFASEEIDLSKRLKAYGKTRGLRMTILHQHPLVTSARKMRLYRRGEWLRLMWRMIATQGKAAKQREACHIWYDGKR